MNRRTFLSGSAGALPGIVNAVEQSGIGTSRAILVRAGQSLGGEIWQLADRSFLHLKLNAGNGEGPLIVEQSQLRRFGPPRHMHPNQDEWFYPLVGTYLIEVGEERFELLPGDFLFAPRGLPHVWMHVEEEPGRLLIGFEPAGKMVGFFRRFTAGGVLPRPEEMPALMAEDGMKFIGPPLKS